MAQDQFAKPYSEDTATLIDNRVRGIIDGQYDRAQEMLHEHKAELEIMAKALLEKEVLHKSDIERMIGPRPYQTKGHPGKDEDPETNPVDQGNNLVPPLPNMAPAPEDMEEI